MEPTPFQPPMTPPRPQVTYAGFWKRFAAILIDKIILGLAALIVILPLVFLFGVGLALNLNELEENPGVLVAFVGLYFMLACCLTVADWLYFALMESKKGATLGKMVLNIKVTDLEGRQISFGRATGRYFGKILSGLTLGIGYIIAGFSQQKQALHDILAKTLVVNK